MTDMPETSDTIDDHDDKKWATVGYLGLFFVLPIVPLIIYLLKDKEISPFLKFIVFRPLVLGVVLWWPIFCYRWWGLLSSPYCHLLDCFSSF